jgi:MFS family permease
VTAPPSPVDASLPLDRVPRTGLSRGFGALAVRNYRLYWLGTVVTASGSWMQQVSLPWLVLALGGSPIQLGAVAVLQYGPAFFIAPFGGVVADRIDKRWALIAAHAAGLAQVVVLFVLAATGLITLPLVFVMALWVGLVNGVEMPMRHSFAPDLVPRHLLPNAIALQGMAFNTARIIGPAIAGALIGAGTLAFGSTIAGVASTMAVSIVAYSAVLVALLRMDGARIHRIEQTGSAEPMLASLREGIRFARTNPIVLWPLVLTAGITTFGFNFQILLPLYARDVLALDATGYGALFTCLGVGSIAGSLTLAFMRKRPALLLMLGGCAAFATGLAALGLTDNLWVALPIVFLLGTCWMFSMNTVNATIQANVSDALRGRVMALYITVFVGSAPVGGLIAGALAESFGTRATFVVCAALALSVVFVAAWGLRSGSRTVGLGVTHLDG